MFAPFYIRFHDTAVHRMPLPTGAAIPQAPMGEMPARFARSDTMAKLQT